MAKLSKKRENYYKHLYFYGKTYHSVKEFYKTCSEFKIIVEKNIIDRMIKEGGTGYRVLGGNCSYFVCAYLTSDVIDGTGVLVVNTYENTYRIKL